MTPVARRAIDAVDAFNASIAAKDEAAARAVSTERGFAAEGDSVGRFYAQGVRKGFRLEPLLVIEGQGGRVAVTALHGVAESTRSVGQVWVLGYDDGERCLLEGVARNAALIALFSEGHADAIFDGRALPEAPAPVQAWGASVARALGGPGETAMDAVLAHFAADSPGADRAIEAVGDLLRQGVGACRVVGSGEVAALGRATVGLAITPAGQDYEQELWLVVEGPIEGDRARVVAAGGSPTADYVLGRG